MGSQVGIKRQRTCIVCGMNTSKDRLFRIVRSKDGMVFFDYTGRAFGRGAYVCSLACFKKGCTRDMLSRALRKQLDNSDYQRLETELVSVLQDCR